MAENLLSTGEAAQRLGVSRQSLYEWLARSDAGELMIQGQPVTINYLQGGPKGQGRIMIEADEVERLTDFMRVRPIAAHTHRSRDPRRVYPGIVVKLGRPDS
jgi:hypothetical protein